MPELQPLGVQHAEAVLTFERRNRAFFARTVSDRGDDWFAAFPAEFAALLAEQDAGTTRQHLLIDDDGRMLGRFNLHRLRAGTADVGYRVAEEAAGRGLASAGVRALCALAWGGYGMRLLRAAAARDNVASRRVLTRNGFTAVREADPSELGGRAGDWFERHAPAARPD
ncbi:GNAT family N-acetyltransferase [Amnibacterium setariae]|uniref:N-acetyltransferase n=1 Tax=Amnibacterium setariae TaxID=2306585 RepID=A0A3A1U405_9MICO|nr:GNAT family N-acetyltransferase [Amnibacterium setariae]RIX28577.1 N-acetyltransferase [Amnibacterium setariae]